MTLNRIAKADLEDLDIVDAYELASDGNTSNSIYLDTTVVSTDSATKTVVVDLAADGQGILFSYDHPAEIGDILWLDGTSGGDADGYYTIATIIDDTSLTVNETIADSTGGNAQFRYPAGATKVGVDSRTFGYSSSNNVQNVFSDLDTYLSALSLNGDVTGPLLSNTVININGSPVTTIGATDTVLGTTDGSNITYFKISDAQISTTAAILTSKLADATALSVLGRSANSTGAHADIVGANNQVLRISGSVLGFGAIDLSTAQVTGVLPDANQAAQTLGGDLSGTTAAAVVIKINGSSVTTIGAANTVLGTTDGTNITYFQIANAQVSSSAAIDVSKLAAGTDGYILKTITGVPAWDSIPTGKLTGRTTAGTGGYEDIGVDTTLTLTALTLGRAALSGDVSVSANSNTTVIGANKVLDTMLRASAALSVIGRSANSSGDVADISGTNNQVLRISGSVLGFGAIDLSTAQVTGVLPDANQAAQTMAGDVTGTTAANTVVKFQGRALSSSAPTDGYVLTWDTGSSTWVTTGHFIDTGSTSNYIKFGGASSTSGTIRFNNSDSIQFRNALNSANLFLIGGASDNAAYIGESGNAATYLRSGGNVAFRPTANGTDTLRISSTILNMLDTIQTFGSANVATDGYIRFSNSTTSLISQRNAAAGANIHHLSGDASDQTILGDTTNTANALYLVKTAGTHLFKVNGTTEYSMSSSVMDFTNNAAQFGTNPAASGLIRVPKNSTAIAARNTANSADLPIIRILDTDLIIIGGGTEGVAGIQLETTTGNTTIKIATATEYDFSSTTANFNSNTITNPLNIQFPGLGVSSIADGYIRVPNATSVIVARNAANNADLVLLRIDSVNKVFLGNNDVSNAVLSVVTGGDIQLRVNNSQEYIFNGTTANFTDNVLAFGTNPAASGTIRLANNTSIKSRNNGNSGDVNLVQIDNGDNAILGDSAAVTGAYIDVKTGGTINLRVAGTGEYIFTSSVADFTNNAAQWGTNPATAGNIRLPTSAGNQIVFRDNANGANLQGMFSGTDDVLYLGDSTGGVGMNLNVKSTGFHNINYAGTAVYSFDSSKLNTRGGSIRMGASGTQATDGYINFTQNPGRVISIRNYDDTGTQEILNLAGNNTFTDLRLGDESSKGTNTVYLRAKSQHIMTVNGTSIGLFNSTGLTLFPGSNPATTGTIRMANGSTLVTRNGANTQNIQMFNFGASDELSVGDSTQGANINYDVKSSQLHNFRVAGSAEYTFSSSTADFKDNILQFGTTPATTGTIRLSNNTGIYARNSTNAVDVFIAGINNTSIVLIGDANSGGITYNTAAGNNHIFQNNSVTQYSFGPDTSDWNVNTMFNSGNLIDYKRAGTDLTDADVTKALSDGYCFVLPSGTLTTTRNFTASLTGVANGHTMVIKRYDTSANTYVIKNNAGTALFTMPASQKYFCQIWKNPLSGTDWLLMTHGALH